METPISSIATGAWKNVVITMDQVDTSADPIIYINGVLQTLTEAVTPGEPQKMSTASILLWKLEVGIRGLHKSL